MTHPYGVLRRGHWEDAVEYAEALMHEHSDGTVHSHVYEAIPHDHPELQPRPE
jgi:hypothetical protein